MTKRTRFLASTLLAAAVLLPATFSPAHAGLLAAVNYASYQSYSDNGSHQLKLSAAGQPGVTFNTTVAKQKVVITFHALCQVVAPTAAWIGLKMRVDGQSIEISGPGSMPACYAATGSTYGEITRVLVTQVATPGQHSFTMDVGAYYTSSYTLWPTTVTVVW